MSVKPVAWMYHYHEGVNHTFSLNRRPELLGWIETPLSSAADASELAEALQALLDASDCPQYNAAKDVALKLLARITPK